MWASAFKHPAKCFEHVAIIFTLSFAWYQKKREKEIGNRKNWEEYIRAMDVENCSLARLFIAKNVRIM